MGSLFKKANWRGAILSSIKNVSAVVWRALGFVAGLLLTVILIGGVCAIIVGGTFAIYLSNYVDSNIDEFDMLTNEQDLTTIIYYVDDEGNYQEVEGGHLYSSQNRVWVDYTQFPKELIQAYIAVEDKRFYDHEGVDWKSTVKITLKYLIGQEERGASTITQQLIKNITGDDDHTIQRKVQEIFRALNLEKVKSKEEILEMYLNTLYLSQGCYGVQSASQKYFGKDVSELTLLECCAIAGISQYPTKWDPILNPNNNKERRQTILTLMLDQGKISEATFNELYNQDIVLYSQKDEDIDEDDENDDISQSKVTSWYVDLVMEDTISLLMNEYNITKQAATQMLYSGGLNIVTAMDPEVQKTMEDVYTDENLINTLVEAPASIVQPESAMVVLDPYSGNILGIVGARGTKTRSRAFNYATMAKRQPGSSIKPLSVYSIGIELGVINYSTVFDDVPQKFIESIATTGETVYRAWPTNSPSTYAGLTTVADALARSVNTIAVQILERVGLENSYKFLTEKLHISSIVYHNEVNGYTYSDLDYGPLGLGGLTYGASVYEMTNAYTIFTNDGVWVKARSVLQINDNDGKAMIKNNPNSEIALSVETAAIMRIMMHNVFEYGTAKTATIGESVYCCGKTGTTSKNYDKWFIGYSKYYLGGVWFGYEHQQKLSIFPGNPSLKIWNEVMTRLHANIIAEAETAGRDLTEGFTVPASIVKADYCADSGLLQTETCALDPRGSRTMTGYFTRDNMPETYCETHVKVRYCNVGKAIASEYCPDDCCSELALIKVTDRCFPIQIKVTDAQYTFRDLPIGMTVTVDEKQPFYANSLLPDEDGNPTYCGLSGYYSYRQSKQFNCYCSTHYSDQPFGMIWYPDEYQKYLEDLFNGGTREALPPESMEDKLRLLSSANPAN